MQRSYVSRNQSLSTGEAAGVVALFGGAVALGCAALLARLTILACGAIVAVWAVKEFVF